MSAKQPAAQRGTDINIRRVLGSAGGVVIAIIIALALARGLLAAFGARIHDPARAPRESPPAPSEQVRPIADYQKYREAEEAKLTAYGWVDRKSGIAQIPIERAMSLVARDEPNASSGDRRRQP